MDLRQLLPTLIIGGGFAFVGAILYGAWLLGRYHGRDENSPAELASVEARLYRVEQSMSEVTGALQRLEAAHRLTARILTDLPTDAVRPQRRLVTPH